MCFGDSPRFLISAFKKTAYYGKFQIHIKGERTVDCPLDTSHLVSVTMSQPA